jgi:hypothetical protein
MGDIPFLGGKAAGREADHSPPPSAEDKNGRDVPRKSLWHSA